MTPTNNHVKTNNATGEEALRALAQKIERPLAEIRTRAHQRFEQRGFEHGHDLEDWLAAERELFEVPPVELTESPETIEIRMTVPGFTADQLAVTALPETVTVEGDCHAESTNGKGNKKKTNGAASDATMRQLFCQVALPRAIQPEEVTATLETHFFGPVLVIAARKSMQH